MATLRKLRNKWYIRERVVGQKEKLLPTDTSDFLKAKHELRRYKTSPEEWKREHGYHVLGRGMSTGEATDAFISDKKRMNLRPATIRSYEDSFKNLYTAVNRNSRIASLREETIDKVIDILKQKGLKPNSINVNLRSIRTFFNWLYDKKYISEKIRVRQMRVDKPLPKILRADEIQDVFAKVDKPKVLASFKVYLRLGLRPSELRHCRRDGDFVIVSAIHAKGRRDRVVPLPFDVVGDFEFATTSPLSPQYLSKEFTKYKRLAKVDEEKTLHSLRHTYAARKWIETNDIYMVKQLLGHQDIQTTEIYLRIQPDYLKQILGDQRHDAPLEITAVA